MARRIVPGKFFASFLLVAALLSLVPAPVKARPSVTIQIGFHGVLACGVTFAVYFSQTYGLTPTPGSGGTALLNYREGALAWGVPLPESTLTMTEMAEASSAPDLSLPILRWEF